MLRQLMKKEYGIEIDDEQNVGMYKGCIKDEHLFYLVPIGSSMEEDELVELEELASHFKKTGDKSVSQFLQTKDGKKKVEWDQGVYSVLQAPALLRSTENHLGRKLGKFHYRGRSVDFSVTKVSRIGNWKQLWEKRLDQMEGFWNSMLYQQPENDFDRLFLESFPYYMGLAENSIQYLVETEIDDEPTAIDSGTVCHVRYVSSTWGDHYQIKNPFDWVFDHCSRDIAEWTRERYFRNNQTYQRDVKKFLSDYQSIMPLSAFSWRLLYARLLFPLHYFECIENYYSTNSEQQKNLQYERLNKFLQQSSEHERFLGGFFYYTEVPIRQMKIPQIDWLKGE